MSEYETKLIKQIMPANGQQAVCGNPQKRGEVWSHPIIAFALIEYKYLPGHVYYDEEDKSKNVWTEVHPLSCMADGHTDIVTDDSNFLGMTFGDLKDFNDGDKEIQDWKKESEEYYDREKIRELKIVNGKK